MECAVRQIDISGTGRKEPSGINSKQETRQKDFLSMLLKNETREESAGDTVEPPIAGSDDTESKDNAEDITKQGLNPIVTLLQNHVNESNAFLNLKFPVSLSPGTNETRQSLVPLDGMTQVQAEHMQTAQITGEDVLTQGKALIAEEDIVKQEQNSVEVKLDASVNKQDETLLQKVKSDTPAPIEEKQQQPILASESEEVTDTKGNETKQSLKSETQKNTSVEDNLSAEKSITSVSQDFTKEIPVQKLEVASGKEAVKVPANDAQELVKNLSEQILLKSTGKENEFEVQLEPMNLGKLAIKVAHGAEGTTVSIVCTTEKALKLLTTGARNVAMIMEAHLDTPTTIIVDESRENYLEQHKEQSNQRQQQQEQKNETKSKHDETIDFMQQLRLGLVAGIN